MWSLMLPKEDGRSRNSRCQEPQSIWGSGQGDEQITAYNAPLQLFLYGSLTVSHLGRQSLKGNEYNHPSLWQRGKLILTDLEPPDQSMVRSGSISLNVSSVSCSYCDNQECPHTFLKEELFHSSMENQLLWKTDDPIIENHQLIKLQVWKKI